MTAYPFSLPALTLWMTIITAPSTSVLSFAPRIRGGSNCIGTSQSRSGIRPESASPTANLWHGSYRHSRQPLFANNNGDNSNNPSNGEEVFDLDVLQQRILTMRVESFEQEVHLPPNPHLSSKDFVRQLLRALYDNSNPLPDTGFRVLLRSSTPQWRHTLFHSVGAPDGAEDEVVASALGEAIARPNNQFAILVDNDNNNNNSEKPPFVLDFPTDVVDYGDGTCWLECRLRSRDDGELLVAMGWQLQRQAIDGAWLVDQMDWQDFRDKFRPGIGREEWMRICG